MKDKIKKHCPCCGYVDIAGEKMYNGAPLYTCGTCGQDFYGGIK
jgi:transposase-like protein